MDSDFCKLKSQFIVESNLMWDKLTSCVKKVVIWVLGEFEIDIILTLDNGRSILVLVFENNGDFNVVFIDYF